jgi:hypothetical protein
MANTESKKMRQVKVQSSYGVIEVLGWLSGVVAAKVLLGL